MLCLYCGGICDPHPSRFCVNCRAEIARNNERAEFMYILKMCYRHVPEIWLRNRIEIIFEREKRLCELPC